ncbi:MAG: peptide ABC transporter substrate-binding protein [candidate division Zixibacteria bacterium]|nr:peptide ABC transporter substrate-binding protein [candidate division Zixibacteria bacterium]
MTRYIFKSNAPLSLLLFFLVFACGQDGGPPGDSARTAPDAAADAVAKPLPPDAAPPEEQVYRYQNYEPSNLDISMTVYESGQSEFLFERLTMLDHNNDLIPGAAERWESSPDGKTWTLYLRPGAKWSDGTPVTAHDFAYTYRRLLDPGSGNVYAFFYYDIKGAKAHNQRRLASIDSVGIRTLDDRTLVIETEKACAYLPYILQFPTSSPVPRWQVEKYGKQWTEQDKCVSNSAFQLETWEQGRRMTFTLNPHYNGPNRAYLRRIVRRFTGPVGATSTAGGSGIAAFENDEIDLIQVTSPAELDRIKKDPVLSKQLWAYDGFSTNYIFFRTGQPPFNDVRVRQAIAHAIDQETIANVVLKALVIPAYTMLPPHFPGYAGDRYKEYQTFDLPNARRLLAEAGYPDGKRFPRVEMWTPDAAAESAIGQAAQVVQQQLREGLGIQIDLRNVQGNTYIQRMYEWEIPMSLGGFGYDFPDPQSLLGVVWRSQPKGFTRHDWTNPQFDEMIDRGTGELDPQKRMGFYTEADRILAADVGGAFLWHGLAHELRKPYVKGIKQDRWGNYPFRGNNMTYCDLYIGKKAQE